MNRRLQVVQVAPLTPCKSSRLLFPFSVVTEKGKQLIYLWFGVVFSGKKGGGSGAIAVIAITISIPSCATLSPNHEMASPVMLMRYAFLAMAELIRTIRLALEEVETFGNSKAVEILDRALDQACKIKRGVKEEPR